MVKRKYDYPSKKELIIGTVKNINPYSIFVDLDEYPGRVGMIHISEVARKWIRDIRNWAKKGQKVVCLVMGVDKSKDHVTLSLKRVSDRDKNRRLQEWKRDQKGEKVLKALAEKNDISLNEAYKEVGFDIQENFRDMLEAFEMALKRGPDYLVRKGIPKKWAKKIKKIADERIELKKTKLVRELELRTYEPDGIKKIKKVLKDAKEKYDINFKYVSAPKYKISLETKNPKKGDKVLDKAAEEIKSKFN